MARRKYFLEGQRFGRLLVIDLATDRYSFYNCVCDCSAKVCIPASSLVNGYTKSCGCLAKDMARENFSTHSLSSHPLYTVYGNMIRRCYQSNHKDYRLYGARGITVCKEWRDDFTKFYEWAISNGWKKTLHVDREKNNEGYSPANCRVVTCKVNCNNTRKNIRVDYKGEILTIAQLSEATGMRYAQLYWRIVFKGLNAEEAIKHAHLESK